MSSVCLYVCTAPQTTMQATHHHVSFEAFQDTALFTTVMTFMIRFTQKTLAIVRVVVCVQHIGYLRKS